MKLLSAKPESVFPLRVLYRIWGELVKRVEKNIKRKKRLWKGFELLAVDKCTLILPESRELYKKYGAHSGANGIGPVNVEICAVFNALLRIPKRLLIAPCRSSEFKMFENLIKYFDHRHLILIDNGFYSLKLFTRLLRKKANFIIPMASTYRPKVVTQFGKSDYLCEIKSALVKDKVQLRVIYVYRNGFRRRRLLTSLLDSEKYPAAEIAAIYHRRWDIETFYREFKSSMEGKRWHCKTAHAFQIELISKMILACLVRLAGADAARKRNILPADISFARTLTECKCFLREIIILANKKSWRELYDAFILRVCKCILKHKPGRIFSRDKQEYRRNSRASKKNRGRPPKTKREKYKPEIITRYKLLRRKKLPFAVLLS